MRILFFGPNGSGKGTQSAFLVDKYNLAHVESGGIFRTNIKGGTELGKQALAFINKGELVPDSITIPMIIDRLAQDDCVGGWILDGFPRNPAQGSALIEALEAAKTPLDVVIIIELSREISKARLMGRRSCPNGHPNNTAIPAIAPKGDAENLLCWKCESQVSVRADDVDEEAIDQRHNIYYDEVAGTLASVAVVEKWASGLDQVRVIHINGDGDIASIREAVLAAVAD